MKPKKIVESVNRLLGTEKYRNFHTSFGRQGGIWMYKEEVGPSHCLERRLILIEQGQFLSILHSNSMHKDRSKVF